MGVKILALLLLVSSFIAVQGTLSAVTIPKSNDASMYCDVCAFVVGEAERYANQSETVIQKTLLSTCNRIPGQLGNLCNTVVMIYGHQIFQFLLTKETPKVVCCQLHLCTSDCPGEPVTTKLPTSTSAPTTTVAPVLPVATIPPKPIVRPVKDEPVGCTLCNLIVGQVETFLAKNETEELIKQKLELVCAHLPSVMKPECDDVVSQYVPYLIYYLETQFPPNVICELVNLCPIPQNQNNVETCSLCKFGVQFVESYLAQNSTTSFLIKKVGELCDFMPSSLKDRCIEFSKSVPQLVELLESQITPDLVCERFKMCVAPSPSNQLVVKKMNKIDTCPTCTYLVNWVENVLKTNATFEEIQIRLNKFCDRLPHPFTDICSDLAHEYLPRILDMARKELGAQKICTEIKLCDKSAVVVDLTTELLAIVAQEDAMNCEACNHVSSHLFEKIPGKSDLDSIVQVLKESCDLADVKFRNNCYKFVPAVYMQMIKFIASEQDPHQICDQLQLCHW